MCDRVNTSNFPSGNQIILSCESSKMDGSSLICDMVRWPSIMELVSVSFSFNSINTYRSITWRSSINFIYTIFNVYGEFEVVQIMFRSRCYCEMRTKGRKNWAKCIFSIVVRHTIARNVISQRSAFCAIELQDKQRHNVNVNLWFAASSHFRSADVSQNSDCFGANLQCVECLRCHYLRAHDAKLPLFDQVIMQHALAQPSEKRKKRENVII